MRRFLSIALITVLLFSLSTYAAASGEGYTVSMGTDQTVLNGDSVSIPVTVGNTGSAATYNSVDMSFTYDTALLELTSTDLPGFKVLPGSGTVRVIGYGQDRRVGSSVFTLTFRTLGSGTAKVRLVSAKVDNSNHAIAYDAPNASILDSETAVTTGGYPVTLPDGFSGNRIAMPGVNYTFSKPNNGKSYIILVRVNGALVKYNDNGNGTYTIYGELITGPVTVIAYVQVPQGGGGSGTSPGTNPGGGTNGGTNGVKAEFDGLWFMPYVELNGRTVFLIAVAGDPGKNMTYAFDGEPMFYTEKYSSPIAVIGEKVYVFLTIAEQGQTLMKGDIAERITAVSAERTSLNYSYDVNGSGASDISDARLIYEIYNGVFWGFDEMPMQRFLNADINLDGVVNVKDAGAVINTVN